MSLLEIKKIKDVYPYVDDETLVVFDVDNTLIETTGHLGSTAWFQYVLEKLTSRGLSEEEAGMRVYAVWVQLQSFLSVRPVELDMVDFIKQLHGKNIKTIGLTARGFDVSRLTHDQLTSVDISLYKNTIYDKELKFSDIYGYFSGVLSAGPVWDKGGQLVKFLDRIDYNPRKVLFIDDIARYIETVNTSLVARKIPFTGVRYGAADKQYVTFDPARTTDELKTLFKGTEHEKLLEAVI